MLPPDYTSVHTCTQPLNAAGDGMTSKKVLELPEELYSAVERAAAGRGVTVAEWLAGQLDLTHDPKVAQGGNTAEREDESAAARELWLMQL